MKTGQIYRQCQVAETKVAVEVEVLSPSLRTTRRCNNNPFKFLPTFFLNSHLSPHNLQVLCYHGPLLYEAKCVKSRKDTKSGNPGDFQYFVHYQGWNKKFGQHRSHHGPRRFAVNATNIGGIPTTLCARFNCLHSSFASRCFEANTWTLKRTFPRNERAPLIICL